MTDVIQIEEMRLRRVQRTYTAPGCKHMKLSMDGEGDIVTCEDCGKQVSAFWALQMVSNFYAAAMRKLENAQAQHRAETAKTVTLRAAQKVESAWRSRSMVPTCPHCRSGVFPEDGFGVGMVNREMELRRREVAKQRREDSQ